MLISWVLGAFITIFAYRLGRWRKRLPAALREQAGFSRAANRRAAKQRSS